DPRDFYNYIRDPLKRAASLADVSGASTPQPPALTALWINLNRIAYQFLDTTGLPPFIEGYLFRGKAHFDRALYHFLNLPLESTVAANPNSPIIFDFFHRPPPQEDETWFGIFAPLLVVPLGLLRLGRSLRRADPLPAALWGLTLSFTFLELLLRPGWDAYLGRNFILAVVFITPFAAAAYRPAWVWQALVALVVVLSAYALVTLTLNDTARPLVGQHAIWPLSRAEKLTLQNYYLKDAAVMVEKNVPAHATLALPPGVWEYPFYDAHFTRALVTPTANDPFADPAWMRVEGVQYLLVDLTNPPNLAALPLEGITASQDWALYRVLP
ncbi:MAG TPA: hypothetical protein PJ988_22140, partial [Anaerolinea sp.]|nr:hypothetical protein [Anaerolinea sp.]